MSTLFGAIQIAKSSILTHQRALAVVANNLANVNTPNYVRRRVIFEELRSLEEGRLAGAGGGVEAADIQRIVDRFIEAQLTKERQTAGELDLTSSILSRVELIFDETSQQGLNSAINALFIAFQALADNPGGTTERVTLVEKARDMSNQFNRVDSDLLAVQRDLDNLVPVLVDEINRLTAEIAKTNQAILQLEATGASANDLRDRRDGFIRELSDKLAFQLLEDERGLVTVLSPSGQLLVDGTQAFSLQATRKTSLGGQFGVELVVGSGQAVDVTSSLTEGRLGAIIGLRDNLIPQYRGSIDELAAALVNEVNVQHQQGVGLDGSTGADFFSPLSPTVASSLSNTGSIGVSSSSVTDFSALTRDSYTIVFSVSGPPTYTVVRDGTGDTVASGTYTSGTPITFDGLSVTLTGAPDDGDSFTLNVTEGAARKMALDGTLSSSPERIAAGLTTAPGDNQNVLALLDLQSEKVLNFSQGSYQNTFEEYYGGFAVQVFLTKASTDAGLEQQQAIVNQLDILRASTSGVSLEEEMISLTQFQAAFQASVRVLETMNRLLEEILNLI